MFIPKVIGICILGAIIAALLIALYEWLTDSREEDSHGDYW